MIEYFPRLTLLRLTSDYRSVTQDEIFEDVQLHQFLFSTDKIAHPVLFYLCVIAVIASFLLLLHSFKVGPSNTSRGKLAYRVSFIMFLVTATLFIAVHTCFITASRLDLLMVLAYGCSQVALWTLLGFAGLMDTTTEVESRFSAAERNNCLCCTLFAELAGCVLLFISEHYDACSFAAIGLMLFWTGCYCITQLVVAAKMKSLRYFLFLGVAAALGAVAAVTRLLERRFSFATISGIEISFCLSCALFYVFFRISPILLQKSGSKSIENVSSAIHYNDGKEERVALVSLNFHDKVNGKGVSGKAVLVTPNDSKHETIEQNQKHLDRTKFESEKPIWCSIQEEYCQALKEEIEQFDSRLRLLERENPSPVVAEENVCAVPIKADADEIHNFTPDELAEEKELLIAQIKHLSSFLEEQSDEVAEEFSSLPLLASSDDIVQFIVEHLQVPLLALGTKKVLKRLEEINAEHDQSLKAERKLKESVDKCYFSESELEQTKRKLKRRANKRKRSASVGFSRHLASRFAVYAYLEKPLKNEEMAQIKSHLGLLKEEVKATESNPELLFNRMINYYESHQNEEENGKENFKSIQEIKNVIPFITQRMIYQN